MRFSIFIFYHKQALAGYSYLSLVTKLYNKKYEHESYWYF